MGSDLMIGQCWIDLHDALAAGVQRVVLYGPPGTGKTHAALHLGVGVGVAERLVCTEDLTSGEITGTWMPTGTGRWEWREGPAIRAWRQNGVGGRLVIDEVDRASGDALSTLLAVTDSPDSARWRHPDTGEWVHPGGQYSVVMTTNIEDLNVMPDALRDRFPLAIRIDRPHPSAVTALSEDLRVPALHGSLGEPSRRVSLRSFYLFDQLRGVYGAERAARLTLGDHRARGFLDALAVGGIS